MKRSVLGLLSALLVVCSCSENKAREAKSPTRVQTEVVSASAADGGQSYVGIVEEREATAVSFTGMGVVRRVLVSEGQAVSRGQLLAVMDDTQARNLMSGAEAQMTQANDALERYRMLHDNGSLPEVQWVEIQSKVAQAKSQLEVARKNLSDCRLVAPVSGVIGKKFIGAGETALPSQAVVTILDISSVKVKVAVPETEVSRVQPLTSSVIRVEAIDRSYDGGKIEKGVQADALTHTYDVRINVANGDRQLLPGMVASVRFGASSVASAASSPSAAPEVTVPVTAVQRRADGTLFVWTVAQDSTAHRTAVTLGATQGNRVTVNSGVSGSQRIVTEGYQKLSEGTRVVF
ncbi:MAG: efflux RND transporter periplasmic adaptor subunit [Prevotella sp.]|nr:efflux RND transporter periplasmic adaptor subunit [Prevotella sp.]